MYIRTHGSRHADDPAHQATADRQSQQARSRFAAPPGSGTGANTVAQRTLHAMLQHSDRARHLAQLRDDLNNRPRQVHRTTQSGLSSPQPVAQLKGVGGQKVGFKRHKADEDPEAWAKLERCWKAAKDQRRKEKAAIEKTLAAKAGKGAFTAYYASELDKIKDERVLLEEALKADTTGPVVTISSDGKIVLTTGADTARVEKEIGEVITAVGKLYAQRSAATTDTREVFKKENPLEKGGQKDYIKDERGVYTRRIAYHEMNFHQMMDFVMSGELTGRYQMFMSAGEAADKSPTKIFHAANKAAVSQKPTRATGLTWEEVAVMHQWKGSGPYQSGVSLTSTSRAEVRSNKGELFRSQGGFRLTIDLAKVSSEVPIINDYSAQGVANQPSSTTKTKPSGYEFLESSTKNRELYIERVKKNWVTEIVYHGGTDVTMTFAEIEQAVRGDTTAKSAVVGVGIQDYIAGFEAGMKGAAYTGTAQAGTLGVEAGKNAKAGYERGKKKREGAGTVATAVEALKEQTDYEQSKVPPAHKYDAHKIGYMRGRCTTKPMFATAAEYGAAIK
jgi:hypothetical protein